GDRWGNLVFRKTARNFNPLCAQAGKITVVEVEQLVEVGELDPDLVHLPSIYVQRIFQGTGYDKPIEQRTIRPRPQGQGEGQKARSYPCRVLPRRDWPANGWPAGSPPSCATGSTSTSASACRPWSPTTSPTASTSCCSPRTGCSASARSPTRATRTPI